VKKRQKISFLRFTCKQRILNEAAVEKITNQRGSHEVLNKANKEMLQPLKQQALSNAGRKGQRTAGRR